MKSVCAPYFLGNGIIILSGVVREGCFLAEVDFSTGSMIQFAAKSAVAADKGLE